MDGIKEDIEDTEQSEIITYVTQNVDYTQLGQDKKIVSDMIVNGIKSACNGKVNVSIHQYRLKENAEQESEIQKSKVEMLNHFSTKYNKRTAHLILNAFNSAMTEAEVNYFYLFSSTTLFYDISGMI